MIIYVWPDGSWVHADFIPQGFDSKAEYGRYIDLDKSYTYNLTELEIEACVEALER